MNSTEATKMTIAQIKARIAELEATPRSLVGSDEGTHGTPLNHRLYEEITGERYAVESFAGSNGTRITEEEARENTNGDIKYFSNETQHIRGLASELRQLKKLLAKAE